MCSERPVNSFRTNLISLLDNWCTVNTFIASLRKTVKHHEPDFLGQKVEPLLKSKNEFAIRAGLVCHLDFYVQFDYLFLIFDRLESLKDRVSIPPPNKNLNASADKSNKHIML